MSRADAIGLARAVAVVPIAWAIAVDARTVALAVFVVAALSDAADGWVARRDGTSARGALIDPLADKVLAVGTLVALSAAGRGWPVTLVTVLVLLREVVVAFGRLRGFARGVTLPADRLGKLKTAFELAGIVLVIAGGRPWAVLGTSIVGLAFLLSLYTLPRYVHEARTAA